MLRRLGSVLVGFLLLPQLQVGSWTRCTFDRATGGAEGRVEREMPEMAHRGALGRGVAAQSSTRQKGAIVPDGCDAAGECDSHRMPRDAGQCASARTGTVIVAALTMTIVEPDETPAPLEVPESVSLLSTPASAPEPPPPRA